MTTTLWVHSLVVAFQLVFALCFKPAGPVVFGFTFDSPSLLLLLLLLLLLHRLMRYGTRPLLCGTLMCLNRQ